MAGKKRLDQLLVTKGLVESRQRAQALILAGRVLVNSAPIQKPASQVAEDSALVIQGEPLPYVSRGGLKLEGALKEYGLSVAQMVCMDVGASTGGFTDCLLQNGARHVYAVDVGYGQLAWKLRRDPRVSIIERTNIRYLSSSAIPESVDLIVIDTSFISLKIVVPAAIKFLKTDGRILALIKPQFEVGRGKVGKGGIVREVSQQTAVIDGLIQFFKELGLDCAPPVASPILGSKGNQEYLVLLSPAPYSA
jgi:23S rRNA (cytidine1920-2'-O)/16S rRNA (cytidine1409-2'-O)-methyltransferase